VLEAHVYPGGCAGTFYHQGYHFDAGATLAGGFYKGGPMDRLARMVGIRRWPAHVHEPSMVVHLPDGSQVRRWADERRYTEYHTAFGVQSASFWQWQEQTADALWALALHNPTWPPQSMGDVFSLVRTGLHWLGKEAPVRSLSMLAADVLRPVAAHLRGMPESLRLFVDAQLLISAQATSQTANALYGASALDLPRRGVVHLKGGIGAIAKMLAESIRGSGGQVLYHQEVTHIFQEDGRPVAVATKRGDRFPTDLIVANLTPWNLVRLLGNGIPARLRNLSYEPPAKWGAFMAYLGIDDSVVPRNFPLHHQIVVREPLGEGNTLFLSLSPSWDVTRAPAGQRALTLSTHTELSPWWALHRQDRSAYEQRKAQYLQQALQAAEQVLPGLRDATKLALPGTPVTFQRFTRRTGGWVGGFPQTNLLRAWGPRLTPYLWMVGDSIFPGQSTAAVALGGLRVAHAMLAQVGVKLPESVSLLPTQPAVADM
jgi:C-3',4' desaturase CrtD